MPLSAVCLFSSHITGVSCKVLCSADERCHILIVLQICGGVRTAAHNSIRTIPVPSRPHSALLDTVMLSAGLYITIPKSLLFLSVMHLGFVL